MNLFHLLDGPRSRILQARWTPELALGARGEDLAMRFLQKQKFTIVGRNYRPKNQKGEVDLIAWEGKTLAFVEVKTRASSDVSDPERAVHPEKQQHVVRAAQAYTRKASVDWGLVRFDIVTVIVTDKPLLALYRDAFR